MKKLAKSTDKLLTRDEFREAVFRRDNHCCVICRKEAKDAHHILERRLFNDGGYYLSNGASLCAEHHILAEQTTLSVEDIREKIQILSPAIPEHFYPDEKYDKWGNIVLSANKRLKGELFYDESVQKILSQANVLNQFSDYVKYPRTLHFPWSPGISDDDRIHQTLTGFAGEEVVVTEKMDGENTNLYRDYYHTRSLDSSSHASQAWCRNFHAQFKNEIPVGWRICAENLYAKHSIEYKNLSSYLLVFSIWNNDNVCLSWAETKEWTSLLGLKLVPELYTGIFNENLLKNLHKEGEGYVARVSRKFHFSEFKSVVGKYVRNGHVQTSHNWKREKITINKMN